MICKGQQDSKHYSSYNICTECADLMEDLMGEYFLRTIREGTGSQKGYLNYLESGKKYVSDYQKIRKHTKRHIQHMGEHVR
ncbi:MAG: hypothetical protein KKA10_08375, partial [Euryarchaeota archaeon]|nr:hypothetical protein [Euryarchaeota archaeon]